MTAIGTMNHLAFDVAGREDRRVPREARDKGVEVTEIINHSNSLDGGHKADYDPATDDGDVFVRSMYFKDPNGTLLEFACWTTSSTTAT